MTDSAVATPDVDSSHSESGGESQHARPRSRTLKALSLYTGAGGLDLGFEAAGFETVAAVEMDPDCVATLQANRDWPLAAESIHDVPSSRLLAMAALREGDADVLIGGPPCQPFSKCGYWATGDARRLADPRASTVEAYLRVLRDTKPRAYVMENVAGLAFRDKDEGIGLVRRIVDAINREQGTHYGVELLRLNAADFGVPQLRERVFLVGARDGAELGGLRATHRAPDTDGPISPLALDDAMPTYRTAWDALWDLEDDDDPTLLPRGKWAALLPSIPEGQNYLFHTERGDGLPLFGWRRRYWNFLLKLAKGLPSWTLTAQPGPATGPFHWRSRRLSDRELCRLQTIPDSYRVTGNLGAVQRQLGNAVPSALAEVVALALRERLLDAPSVCREPQLLPERRHPVPPPEQIAAVPERYLAMIGDHSAHPGTGKGPRALSRQSGA
jgi:DNA (cytosine-5)-methyltransferase 1